MKPLKMTCEVFTSNPRSIVLEKVDSWTHEENGTLIFWRGDRIVAMFREWICMVEITK